MKAKVYAFSGELLGEFAYPKNPPPQFVLATLPTGKVDVFELQERAGAVNDRTSNFTLYGLEFEYRQVVVFDASKWGFERALLPTA